MTTKLVDPTIDIGDLDGLEKSLSEAVKMAPVAAQEADFTPSAGNAGSEALALPQKYEGKTITDVIDMHKNLESAYGRMANDLGTQRKLTDKLLDLKRTDDISANSLPTVDAESLLDNPTQALDTYLEAREQRVAESTEQRLSEMENSMAQERFHQKHAGASELIASPEFAAWITASPMRSQYAELARGGDYQAAEWLVDDYKATSPAPTGAAPLQAAREAGLSSPTTSSDAANERDGKTIYRRADLVQLKLERPDVYSDPQFQIEILAAYREGRVK